MSLATLFAPFSILTFSGSLHLSFSSIRQDKIQIASPREPLKPQPLRTFLSWLTFSNMSISPANCFSPGSLYSRPYAFFLSLNFPHRRRAAMPFTRSSIPPLRLPRVQSLPDGSTAPPRRPPHPLSVPEISVISRPSGREPINVSDLAGDRTW
ncbi:hypothetical protein DFS33DRAFT_149754 [Desarmillaria ectypa]|nr:hypothetical protein DFS33DRAFT_149754 [Desarmillaria ectypa]